MTFLGQCALCKEHKPLANSHIVPAFAVRYIKATSATGHIRNATTPDKRIQDIETVRLLCFDCEQRISLLERSFANSYLSQLQNDGFSTLAYGSDLYRFSISLAWRCLVCDRKRLLDEFPQHTTHVDDFLERCRLFLLEERRRARVEQHVFVFAGIPIRAPENSPSKYLHYMLRSIDSTAFSNKTSVGVYVKLVRSIFFTPIKPAKAHHWENTMIHPDGGKIVSPQSMLDGRFGSFLQSRVDGAYEKPLSEIQLKKIEDSIKKNPERALRSESMKVSMAAWRDEG